MDVRVFYHDNCFDGACSAALFTRFHRECIHAGAHYHYQGLVHRADALFDERDFTGDENTIVDFKYSPSPRITWWFDHHLSAFLSPEDHHNFLERQKEGRYFVDPAHTSCTSFIADIASSRFGFNRAPVEDLVHWANIVDGALYKSPEAAVEMAEPAMKLTLIIESNQDPDLIPKLIPMLTEKDLSAILAEPFVSALLPPLLDRHRKTIELIRKRAESAKGVIFFNLIGDGVEGYNKFIPYYLHPEATYSVGLSRSSFRTKVAVGTSPWTRKSPEDLSNVAKICERYGGGGHARVGAISFPRNQDSAARAAAAEIVAELRSR